MINKIIKYILIGGSFIFAIILFFNGEIGWGILMILLAGIFVLSLFRHELILKSFWHIRKNEFEKAGLTLDKIKQPEQLPTRGQEAYYNFLRGIILSSTNQYTKSEKFYRKAINLGLRMKQDQAMAKLSLASISIMKRKKMEATMLINEAKKLDTRKILAEQIKYVQEQIKRI
jgi:tetratricopeptide (TPR) repeat protein